MTDRERAIAVGRRQTPHRFHATAGESAEMHDPVKVFNVTGYTTCGDDAVCPAGLWQAAGFPLSPGHPVSHPFEPFGSNLHEPLPRGAV